VADAMRSQIAPDTSTQIRKLDVTGFLTKQAPWVLLLLLVLVPSITNPDFRSLGNLQGFLESAAVLILLTLGESFVLFVAGIDLAVGAGLALGSVILAMSLSSKYGLLVGLILCIGVVGLCGFLNGVIVAYLKIPSFIVTFGMMAAESAVALVLSGGNRIDLPATTQIPNLVYNSFLNVPYETWITIVLVIILGALLHYFRPFRSLYAVGSNATAARLSGISVKRTLILAFTLSGLLSGIGAVLYTARIVSGDPLAGTNLNLEAIAAAVIGGINLFGGRGNMVGAVLGAVIYSLIDNVLNLYGVNPNIAELVGGAILIIAAFMNVVNLRRKGTRA
jgi:ribose/xylose/arabinose/galactoside ABC-type transport system permease subunit